MNLDARTRKNITRLHPDLVRVLERASEISAQPFGVAAQATRTAEEQHALFLAGRSQKDGYKHRSNHQLQADGLGHAVDLTPIVGGKYDVNAVAPQYSIAAAMARASAELNIPLTWGGNWLEPLIGTTPADMRASEARYVAKHPGPDFLDRPHFQLKGH